MSTPFQLAEEPCYSSWSPPFSPPGTSSLSASRGRDMEKSLYDSTTLPMYPDEDFMHYKRPSHGVTALRHAATLTGGTSSDFGDFDEQLHRSSSIQIEARGRGTCGAMEPDTSGSHPEFRAFDSVELGAMYEWACRHPADPHTMADYFRSEVDKYMLEFGIENTFINAKFDGDRVLKSSKTNPEGFGARAESMVQTLVSSSSLSLHDLSVRGDKSEDATAVGLTKSSSAGDTGKCVAVKRDLTEEEIASIPRDENGCLTSVGSVKHAEGTCRPCAFSNNPKKQGCINGIHCTFCHFKHPKKKKPPRPSKQQRMLKKLAKPPTTEHPEISYATEPHGGQSESSLSFRHHPFLMQHHNGFRSGSLELMMYNSATTSRETETPYFPGEQQEAERDDASTLLSLMSGQCSPPCDPMKQTYASPSHGLPTGHLQQNSANLSLSPVLYILKGNQQESPMTPAALPEAGPFGASSRHRQRQDTSLLRMKKSNASWKDPNFLPRGNGRMSPLHDTDCLRSLSKWAGAADAANWPVSRYDEAAGCM